MHSRRWISSRLRPPASISGVCGWSRPTSISLRSSRKDHRGITRKPLIWLIEKVKFPKTTNVELRTVLSVPSNAILFKTYTEGLSSDEKLQFQSEFTARQRATGLGIILALLLGGLGAHKFYLKDQTAGIIYALCGTIGWIIIIPPIAIAILSIIDSCRMGGEVTRFNNALAREIREELEALR